MPIADSDRRVVENLFKGMQKGPGGEDDVIKLFAEDAVFIEPFTGQVQTHNGIEAIRESFRSMWEHPTPDQKLLLDRVDMDGDNVRAEWTCTSPIFATPMRGYDLFTIRDNLIARLEVVVTDMPPMGPE